MQLKDFVGQKSAKQNLELLLAAHKKGRVLPHLLFAGAAGSGKTSLAHIVAEHIGAELVYLNGAAITSTIVFRQPIAEAIKAEGKDKTFLVVIDEAHNLPKKIQELLLSALEKPAILCTVAHKNIRLSNGCLINKGDIIKEKLPQNITFVLCTTEKSMLSDTLLTRLHTIYLSEYSLDEKVETIKNRLVLEDVKCDDIRAIETIAQSTKGMRHLQKVCDRLKDYIVAHDIQTFTVQDAEKLLDILGIDHNGCEEIDRNYLKYLSNKDTVSLSNIARFLNIQEQEVKSKVEPFLIKKDWITIGPRGRKLTITGQQLYGKTSMDDIMEMLDLI